ncbi:hypothetical protein H9P43_005473 [Blastocladiella emersonii ATCC 22665]|nr:hypothetical protein H9P43_005473 [Blastocladiella emersonii ATCC 22665]
MRHPPLRRVLEELAGAQVTKLLIGSIGYVPPWVLLEHPNPWDDPIRAPSQSIPGTAAKECTSLNLAVELCLYRHTEGLLLVQRVSSKCFTGPSRPCPVDALATLDWLVLRAGSEVAVLASQVVSLIANAAAEFPAEAVQCCTSLARVADDKTLARFWLSILLSAARTPAVLEVGPPTMALLDLLFSRATPEVLKDAPDLPAHPVLAPFQARIDAAKPATPSLHDRLARVCARIVSLDLVVAEASLDEALALLTQIHASSADAVVRNLHVVVDALVNVAEYHPTPAVRATVCRGQLGAVDFGDFLGAAAAAMRGEATVSDKDGGLKTGVVAHQEIPVLCAEVLKSCLIPFLRSGAFHFAQTIVAHAIQRLLKLHHKTCLDALNDFDRSTVRHLQDSKYRVDEPMLVAEADAAAAMFQPGAACWFCLRLAARCADSALVAVFRALHPLLAQTQHHEVATALGASHLFQQQQQVGGGGADTVQDPRHLALQHEVRVLAVHHAASVHGSSGSVPTPPTRLSAYQAWRELGSFDLLAEQRTGAITAHRDAPRRRADVFREQRLSCACATIVDRHWFADLLFTFHDTALLETRTAEPTNVEAIVNARY